MVTDLSAPKDRCDPADPGATAQWSDISALELAFSCLLFPDNYASIGCESIDSEDLNPMTRSQISCKTSLLKKNHVGFAGLSNLCDRTFCRTATLDAGVQPQSRCWKSRSCAMTQPYNEATHGHTDGPDALTITITSSHKFLHRSSSKQMQSKAKWIWESKSGDHPTRRRRNLAQFGLRSSRL
jgi:hypothetical protein